LKALPGAGLWFGGGIIFLGSTSLLFVALEKNKKILDLKTFKSEGNNNLLALMIFSLTSNL
jgi:hypothetical protein